MIACVTLNASIDKAYRLGHEIELGHVSRVAQVLDSAGGKGLNAARAVAASGEEVLAAGFVGGNNGRYLLDLLAKDGIAEDFVQVANRDPLLREPARAFRPLDRVQRAGTSCHGRGVRDPAQEASGDCREDRCRDPERQPPPGPPQRCLCHTYRRHPRSRHAGDP